MNNRFLGQKDGQVQYHFDPMNPDAQLCFLKLSRLFQGKPEVLPENAGQIKPLTVSGTRYIGFFYSRDSGHGSDDVMHVGAELWADR
jgi:hypothetical protein